MDAGHAGAPTGLATPDAAFFSALGDDDPEDLYEHAPCAFLSMAMDGTVVKCNETFLRWTGYTSASVVGRRRFQDLLAPGDRIFFETHLAPMLQMQGLVREIAAEVVCASGSRLPVLVNALLKRDRVGAPMTVRTVLFDATERRSYEDELLAARRRAEEAEARSRSLAETLQSTFLPPETPPVPGLDVAGAYRPAGDGAEVGGDFYDVFETGRGSWGIVLGDVCGKGAQAAVVTALARYTVRAEALRTPYPSAVLAALHQAMLRYHPDRFCTALLLVFEPAASGRRLTVASGGHHLPLRRSADGHIEPIGRPGAILGLLDMARVSDTAVVLSPGDLLVLYTDGVTEARRDGRYFGQEGLRSTIEATAGFGAREVADAVVADAVSFQGGTTRDDIAVVAVRVPPGEG